MAGSVADASVAAKAEPTASAMLNAARRHDIIIAPDRAA
jgi:hypothetical protein